VMYICSLLESEVDIKVPIVRADDLFQRKSE
jgi:hypothetical protein